ncbi:hypothetical protein GH733_010851 [Mirounga leonina]|nr:hypothetical protein GH733_010851 [Mirounga leonina]
MEAMVPLLNNSYFAVALLLQYTNSYFSSTQGPFPLKWQMTCPKLPCVNKTADEKLEILQNGLYLIYGQVAPNTTYKEPAPFEVRLCKNEDIIQALTKNSKIQNVGGTYELHAGDILELIYNSEHQVLKNNTYWGILLLANPQYNS